MKMPSMRVDQSVDALFEVRPKVGQRLKCVTNHLNRDGVIESIRIVKRVIGRNVMLEDEKTGQKYYIQWQVRQKTRH